MTKVSLLPISRFLMAWSVVSVSLLMMLLTGCGKKEEAPSAAGYYSGPMKPKGTVSGTGADAKPSTGPTFQPQQGGGQQGGTE